MMAQIQDQPASLPFEILEILVTDDSPIFDDIIALVKQEVRQVNKNAMMLAWYNRLTGQGYPDYRRIRAQFRQVREKIGDD